MYEKTCPPVYLKHDWWHFENRDGSVFKVLLPNSTVTYLFLNTTINFGNNFVEDSYNRPIEIMNKFKC